MSLKSDSAKAEAMQVGDYIEMPARGFNDWYHSEATGDQSILDRDGNVKVRIIGIDRSCGYAKTVTVEADGTGVKKTVDASLFYNYYRRAGEHVG